MYIFVQNVSRLKFKTDEEYVKLVFNSYQEYSPEPHQSINNQIRSKLDFVVDKFWSTLQLRIEITSISGSYANEGVNIKRHHYSNKPGLKICIFPIFFSEEKINVALLPCPIQMNLIWKLRGNSTEMVSNVEFNSLTKIQNKERSLSGAEESKHFRLNIHIFIIYELSLAR